MLSLPEAAGDPAHVAELFQDKREEIEAKGEAEVLLAGRPFRIQKQFHEDIERQKLENHIANLKKALLVFHSPVDATVGIDNAAPIFAAAKHPKSFVSLDDADHLLSRKADAAYVADVIAAWVDRYLGLEKTQKETGAEAPAGAADGAVVVSETGTGKLANTISIGARHSLTADEPATYGGDDTGPTPYDFLLSALGACKSMTMRMYADHKGYPMDRAIVTLRHDKIHAEDCAECETGKGRVDRIETEIEILGDMDTETRQKIAAIAEKCPVHKSLKSEVLIESRLKE